VLSPVLVLGGVFHGAKFSVSHLQVPAVQEKSEILIMIYTLYSDLQFTELHIIAALSWQSCSGSSEGKMLSS
jgi:hypothetical protein